MRRRLVTRVLMPRNSRVRAARRRATPVQERSRTLPRLSARPFLASDTLGRHPRGARWRRWECLPRATGAIIGCGAADTDGYFLVVRNHTRPQSPSDRARRCASGTALSPHRGVSAITGLATSMPRRPPRASVAQPVRRCDHVPVWSLQHHGATSAEDTLNTPHTPRTHHFLHQRARAHSAKASAADDTGSVLR